MAVIRQKFSTGREERSILAHMSGRNTGLDAGWHINAYKFKGKTESMSSEGPLLCGWQFLLGPHSGGGVKGLWNEANTPCLITQQTTPTLPSWVRRPSGSQTRAFLGLLSPPGALITQGYTQSLRFLSPGITSGVKWSCSFVHQEVPCPCHSLAGPLDSLVSQALFFS